MRVAGAFIYASFVAAVFASAVDRTSPLWVVLVWAVVVTFVAALIRVHAVINAPKEEEK